MLEILFNDSACGSLKIAQHYGEGPYQCGSFGVIVSHSDGSKPTKEEIEAARQSAEEKARIAWEKAIPMGGNTADIYCFHLMLSIGDISEKQPSTKRLQTLKHLYSVYPNDVGHEAAQELLRVAEDNLKTIKDCVTAGESLRIWYSNQPDEMCGLYWFLNQLQQWNVYDEQVYMVKLPQWEADANGNIVQRNSWGEVPCEEWNHYLNFQEPVLPVFQQYCAAQWQELQKEMQPYGL